VVLLVDTLHSTKGDLVKISWQVVIEVSHLGVKYSVTQKVSELRGNHIRELIHKHLKFTFDVKIKNKSKVLPS
jgi:hypothetical protein